MFARCFNRPLLSDAKRPTPFAQAVLFFYLYTCIKTLVCKQSKTLIPVSTAQHLAERDNAIMGKEHKQ